MEIVNLNKHAVKVVLADGTEKVYQPSGTVAMIGQRNDKMAEVDGIPVSGVEYGDVTGVPEPRDGVVFIVNMLVGQRLAGQRDDLVAPDSGPTSIRDEKGNIVAVRGFVKYGVKNQ